MKAKFYAEIIVVLMIGAGCATYGDMEKDYGNSYNMAKTGQIMNPAGSKNLKPVMGLPGEAAEMTMEKYIQSFWSDPVKAGQKKNGAPEAPSQAGGQDVYGK